MNKNYENKSIHQCICCSGNDWNIIPETDGNDYARCNSCNYYIQISEASSLQEDKFEEEQKKFYNEDSLMLSPLFSYLQKQATDKRFEVLRNYLPKGKILEIGPGNGDVLEQALKYGYDIEAVEHSETLASVISKRLGVNVRAGAFENQIFEGNPYDAYMSFHVIEHVPDVISHLRKASSVVKLGGYAFIATPNADSWEQNMPFKLSPNYSTAHLQLFSKKGLSLCLEQTGWEVVKIITPEYPSSWLRVATSILRRLKGSKNAAERGEYIKSSNSKSKIFVQIFSLISYPFRKFQESIKSGNELFIVAKRVIK